VAVASGTVAVGAGVPLGVGTAVKVGVAVGRSSPVMDLLAMEYTFNGAGVWLAALPGSAGAPQAARAKTNRVIEPARAKARAIGRRGPSLTSLFSAFGGWRSTILRIRQVQPTTEWEEE